MWLLTPTVKTDGAALVGFQKDSSLLQRQERKRGDSCHSGAARSRDRTLHSPESERGVCDLEKSARSPISTPASKKGAEFTCRNLTNFWPQPSS